MSHVVEKFSPVAMLQSVLAIHCSANLLRRVVAAGARAGMSARECDLRTMGRAAMQRRPTAIIVPSYLHEFDPTEFEALARDVGAVLVVVDEEVGQPELDELVARGPATRPIAARSAGPLPDGRRVRRRGDRGVCVHHHPCSYARRAPRGGGGGRRAHHRPHRLKLGYNRPGAR